MDIKPINVADNRTDGQVTSPAETQTAGVPSAESVENGGAQVKITSSFDVKPEMATQTSAPEGSTLSMSVNLGEIDDFINRINSKIGIQETQATYSVIPDQMKRRQQFFRSLQTSAAPETHEVSGEDAPTIEPDPKSVIQSIARVDTGGDAKNVSGLGKLDYAEKDLTNDLATGRTNGAAVDAISGRASGESLAIPGNQSTGAASPSAAPAVPEVAAANSAAPILPTVPGLDTSLGAQVDREAKKDQHSAAFITIDPTPLNSVAGMDVALQQADAETKAALKDLPDVKDITGKSLADGVEPSADQATVGPVSFSEQTSPTTEIKIDASSGFSQPSAASSELPLSVVNSTNSETSSAPSPGSLELKSAQPSVTVELGPNQAEKTPKWQETTSSIPLNEKPKKIGLLGRIFGGKKYDKTANTPAAKNIVAANQGVSVASGEVGKTQSALGGLNEKRPAAILDAVSKGSFSHLAQAESAISSQRDKIVAEKLGQVAEK